MNSPSSKPYGSSIPVSLVITMAVCLVGVIALIITGAMYPVVLMAIITSLGVFALGKAHHDRKEAPQDYSDSRDMKP